MLFATLRGFCKTGLLVLFFVVQSIWATNGVLAGSGTSSDPFQVADYADLKTVGTGPYSLLAQYRLVADIDASPSRSENCSGGVCAGFTPIGALLGSFHGAGHIIKNLNIQLPNNDYIGLFSQIGSSGRVDSLGIANLQMSGKNYTGGLAGLNTGAIQECYASGFVRGSSTSTGGLAGYNSNTIVKSYAVVHVVGVTSVGGLAGNNTGSIDTSYSAGRVQGTTKVGGLVGEGGYYTKINECYWDRQSSGLDSSYGSPASSGLTSIRMAATQTYANWIFTTNWESPGLSPYPFLRGVRNAPLASADYVSALPDTSVPMDASLIATLTANDFEPNNPTTIWTARWTDSTKYSRFYQVGSVQGTDTLWGSQAEVRLGGIIEILTYEDLKKIGNDPLYPLYGHYRLKSDLNASVSKSESCLSSICAGFQPIGSWQAPFSGIINGNGYTIRNLYINSSDSANTGLVGYASRDALIMRLGVVNARINGNIAVGALVGRNNGNIENTFVTDGSVTATNYAGGSVGYNKGILSSSYTATQVSGYSYLGGLVGMSNGDSIRNCYTTGSVQGRSYIGGLIGRANLSTVQNSYTVGPISGIFYVGGLVGYVSLSDLSTSYWNKETTGLDSSMEADPTQGLTTQQMLTAASFPAWPNADWTFDEGNSYPVLTSLPNLPFAFTTTGATQPNLPTVSGYFSPYPTAALVGRWTSMSRLNSSLDSVYSYYQVGYALNATDTLWAGMAPMVTPAQPIPIANYAQLKSIGLLPAYPLWGSYQLTSDIDASLSATENWNGTAYAGFKPIGSDTLPFTGAFDGQGHSIRNISINRTDSYYAGLFSMVAGNARVKDLSLKNASITGVNYVGGITGYNLANLQNVQVSGRIVGRTYTGGIAGYNRSLIQLSSFTGNLNASANYSGGLVGYNYYSGTIKESFASAQISGGNYVGGLVGTNHGVIADCYTLGSVAGSYVGGLVGNLVGTIDRSYAATRIMGTTSLAGFVAVHSGQVTDSYWNMESARTPLDNSTAVGVKSNEMVHGATFMNWDFSVNSPWKIDEGQGFPALRNLDNPPVAFLDFMFPLPDTSGGMAVGIVATLTANDKDPDDAGAQLTARWVDSTQYDRFYQVGTVVAPDTLWGSVLALKIPVINITTYAELKKIGTDPAYSLGYDYRLANDIDASASLFDDCASGSCSGFLPIGSSTSPFSGNFNGAGFALRNLTIRRPSEDLVGLFRTLASSAKVDSLSVQYTLLQGKNSVGGISGTSSGLIEYSQVTGVIVGALYTGGLVGQLSQGRISKSFATAYVSATNYAGGLVGLSNGHILDSYATGNVSATQYIGGLVGAQNSGKVFRSFSTGPVKTGFYSGGLIGYNSYGTNTVVDSYWNKENSHQEISGGMSVGSGSTTTQMQLQASYNNWDFASVWDIIQGQSYPYLRGLSNAPFAFPTQASLPIPQPAVQGYYPTNPLAPLVGRWIPDSILNSTRDSLLKTYQIGVVLAQDDTLWGGFSHMAYPYEAISISNYSDLKKIGTNGQYPLWGSYRLTGDIDASPSQTENAGSGFLPIGNSTQPFTGSFRGGGHTISGLTVKRSSTDYVGLFGSSSAYLIDSVHIVDASITGYSRTGILAGASSGTVRDCSASGYSKGDSYTGGLIGLLTGTLENSQVNAKVVGYEYVGGLVGYHSSKLIKASSARGSVSGYSYIGGISGYNSGTIEESYSMNTVTASSNYAGGLVGYNSSSLNRNYATGRVSASKYAGGLVGYNANGVVHNNYFTGIINSPSLSGSLVGYLSSGSLDSCYTTSRVIKNNYYEDTIVGQAYTGTLMSHLYSHGSMHAADYPGLDFASIWNIDEGQSYPYLRNMDNAPFAFPVISSQRPTLPSPTGYYEEHLQLPLVAKWQELETLNSVRDTLFLYYTIGSVIVPGDTLWGGNSYHAIPIKSIEIANYSDLSKIGKDTNYPLNGVYQLTADIDASQSAKENYGYGFVPIGSSTLPFTGIFHGSGHVIRNLTINRSATNSIGLFSTTSYAIIDSLGLVNAAIRGRSYVGALVGTNNYTSIHASYSSGTVKGTSNVAGLVGQNNYSPITYCYTTSNIQATSMVGGLVGESRYSKISESYATGAVNATSSYSGGLVGYSNYNKILNTYATGEVRGSSTIGALVGYSNGDTIRTSYAAGVLNSSYSSLVGGLLGRIYNSTIDSCFWNKQTTGIDTSAGEPRAKGLSTQEMLTQASYKGWNFASIWSIDEKLGYPALRNVENAPFAFADTLAASAVVPAKSLFANDFNPQTSYKLVLSPDSLGPIRLISGQLLMSSGSSNGDTLWIRYRAGCIRVNDTLWGNSVNSVLIVDNTPPDSPHPPELSTAEDTPIILKISLLNLTDADNDPLSLSIISGDNYTVAGYRISPARDFNGTLQIPFSITDGMDTSEIRNLVLHVTPVNDPPVRVRPLPDLQATQDMSLPVDDVFFDVDGDSLVFNVTSSDSSLATGVVIDGKMLLHIADSAAGFLHLYISATDGQSPPIFDTLSVTLPGILPLPEPPPSPDPDVPDTAYTDQIHLRFTGGHLQLELETATASLVEIIFLDQNGSRLPPSQQKNVTPGKYSWSIRLHGLGTGPCIVAIRLNGKVLAQHVFHQ